MSRTLTEIYNTLAVSKASMQELHGFVVDKSQPGTILDNSETLLEDLSSGSKVATWRVWLWLFAFGSWICEKTVDTIKASIQAIIDGKTPHTLRWYAEESKKYQYGYAMIWDGNQYKYAVIDEAAKVVKYAAASEKDGSVILKVANEIGGVKVKLTNIQKATFTQFWEKWKDAGVSLVIRSADADILKTSFSIIRDRLVLNANNSLLRDATVFPIDDAIAAFQGALEFDGIIWLDKLVDAVQKAEGVVSVRLNSAQWKPAGGTYSNVTLFVESFAGYFILDGTSQWEFIDNVNVQVNA